MTRALSASARTAPQQQPADGARARLVLLAAMALIPTGIAVATTLSMAGRGHAALGTSYPGPATALASTLGRTVVVLASTACLGALVVAAPGALRVARAGAAAWASAAALLIVVDAADGAGRPPAPLPGLPIDAHLGNGLLPAAWLVSLACLGVLLVAVTVSRSWTARVVGLAAAATALLAPLLVGQVLIGPGHDFAGDATILGAPAAAAWCGATGYLFVAWRPGGGSVRLLRGYGRVAAVCWPVVAGSHLVVAVVETQGTALLATSTGRLFAVQFAVLIVLGLLLLGLRRADPEGAAPGGVRTRRMLAVATVLGAGYLGADLARLRIPPPSFFVPTSVTQTYLGYDLPVAPTLRELALVWRPNLLFTALALTAVWTYLIGVRRLARRGDRWPPGRTVTWVLGWALVVVVLDSGVGRYAGAMFSVHMALHMTLTMFIPILLVLGGPLTLLLRSGPGESGEQEPGLRAWVAALRRRLLVRVLCHPVVALGVYVSSSYVLYYSGLFTRASRYHWAHVLMNLGFLAIGYLFFSLVVGVDPPARPLPYPARFGLLLAAMPFHAFFGVAVMSAKGLIAPDFYRSLSGDLTWLTDLSQDQYLGGGIAWVAGELPLMLTMACLLVQWTRQDARQAARTDRHLDLGLDDSFDVYNAMLARLAARDRAQG